MAVSDDPLEGSAPPLDRPPPPRDWRERVEHLADATGVSPARLVIGAVAVAVAAVAVLWVMRPPPAPAELALPFASTTAPTAPGGSGAPPGGSTPGAPSLAPLPHPDPAGSTEVVVHVAGAVHDSGVHRLEAGARVVDAVRAAGGLLPEADELRVNLAAPVTDGERVYVPRAGEDEPPDPVAGAAAPAPAAGAAPGQPPVAPVDLNRAEGPELETLPGVGPATAAAILEHRALAGPFTSVEQLMDVRGIGPAKLEQLRPLVRV